MPLHVEQRSSSSLTSSDLVSPFILVVDPSAKAPRQKPCTSHRHGRNCAPRRSYQQRWPTSPSTRIDSSHTQSNTSAVFCSRCLTIKLTSTLESSKPRVNSKRCARMSSQTRRSHYPSDSDTCTTTLSPPIQYFGGARAGRSKFL